MGIRRRRRRRRRRPSSSSFASSSSSAVPPSPYPPPPPTTTTKRRLFLLLWSLRATTAATAAAAVAAASAFATSSSPSSAAFAPFLGGPPSPSSSSSPSLSPSSLGSPPPPDRLRRVVVGVARSPPLPPRRRRRSIAASELPFAPNDDDGGGGGASSISSRGGGRRRPFAAAAAAAPRAFAGPSAPASVPPPSAPPPPPPPPSSWALASPASSAFERAADVVSPAGDGPSPPPSRNVVVADDDDATSKKRIDGARSAELRIVELGREGKTDEALALYYAVREYSSDGGGGDGPKKPTLTTRVLNAAIDACARGRPPRVETAREIFAEATTTPAAPAAEGGGRKAEEGKGGGKRRKGKRRRRKVLRPNVFTFGSLMSCHARDGDADGATELLKTMQEDYRVPPNAVVYSAAISACERSRPVRSKLALSLLRESISKHPTVETTAAVYNAALSALARAGEWNFAVRLLEEMEGRGGRRGKDDDDDADGNGGARRRRGPGTEKGEDGDRDGDDDDDDRPPPPPRPLLLPLPPGASHPSPDAVTYGTVMAACERSGEWERVLRYAEALRAREDEDEGGGGKGGRRGGRGVVLDGMALTSALHACQRLGKADEALDYLELMKSLGGKDGDDGGDGGGDGRRDEKGRGARRRRRQTRKGGEPRAPLRGPDAVAYRLAISACARASPPGSRWADAVRLLEEMESKTGEPPDVVAYTAATAGCAGGGEWKRAFALLDRMRRNGVEPNVVTFAVAMSACANASANAARGCESDDDSDDDDDGGNEEEEGATCVADRIESPMKQALKLLNVMKRDESVVDPNVVVYNAAMRACAEALNLRGALNLMEDLKGRGLEPTIVTYGTLMTACERVGDVGAVSDVFRMMREHGKGAASAGEDDEGDGDGDEDGDGGAMKPNEICYGAAISCCRKAREPERAFRLLQKMLEDGLSPNAATFNTVLLAQTQSKSAEDLDRAVVVYKLLRSSGRAPHAKPNRQTYNILIPALASAGRPAVAESLLRRMRGDDDDDGGLVPDVDLYTSTVASYERTGQPLQALRLMESMNKEGGYDFYEVKVLDAAFKGAVSLANVVGRGLRTTPTPSSSSGRGEGRGTNGDEEEEGSMIDFGEGTADDEEMFDR